MQARLFTIATFFCAILGAATAAHANPPKSVVDLLFETKHIAKVEAGTELVYNFERKPSDAALLGAGFTDTIKVKVESEGKDKGKKNVLLNIYSGDRARDPHRITDMDGNPMLVVYLDTAVAHFGGLAGGDRAYLKNTFSSRLGNGSKLDPVKISYKGSDVDGYRVTVKPYENDAARAKMRGYEVSSFSIVVSDNIPGFFAKMVADYKNSNSGSPTLLETTTLDGVGDVK